MWIQIVLIAPILVFIIFLSTDRKRWARKRTDGTIYRVGFWDTLREVIYMVTVDWQTPNYEMAHRLTSAFGPVFSIKPSFLRKVIFVCNDLEMFKKIATLPDWASNRFPNNHYLHTAAFNKPLGLLFGSGEYWREASRLTHKLLHQLDFYNVSHMENLISFEMAEVEADLNERIDAAGGQMIFSPHHLFERSTLNVVSQILMQRRFTVGDPVMEKLLNDMNRANREFSAIYTILEFIPFLKYFPKLTWLHSTQDASNTFYYFVREVMEAKRAAGSHKEPVDFMDGFLQEIEKSKGKHPNYLTDESMLVVMRDMITAGTDTTNSAMEHGILHVSLQPRIQARVQAEIDEVIGQNRNTTYSDRSKMNYTQAVILEILRVASTVPASARGTDVDTNIEDVEAPAGSLVAMMVYGIHRSRKLWDDPDIFRPERFLDENGTLVNIDKIIPFGYGKRACVGETVARVTLFIFFVTLLQRFSFEITKDCPPPSFKNFMGVSRCPGTFYVNVRKRTVE